MNEIAAALIFGGNSKEAKAAAAAANAAAASANEAATAANEAATAANEAVSVIYHDKNFFLSVNEDNSLTLNYDPDAVGE